MGNGETGGIVSCTWEQGARGVGGGVVFRAMRHRRRRTYREGREPVLEGSAHGMSFGKWMLVLMVIVANTLLNAAAVSDCVRWTSTLG